VELAPWHGGVTSIGCGSVGAVNPASSYACGGTAQKQEDLPPGGFPRRVEVVQTRIIASPAMTPVKAVSDSFSGFPVKRADLPTALHPSWSLSKNSAGESPSAGGSASSFYLYPYLCLAELTLSLQNRLDSV